MKKVFILIVSLFGMTAGLFAQEVTTVTLPEGRFQDFFVSLAAMIPIVTFISAFVNKQLRPAQSWIKQVTSWIVAVGLSFVGWYFEFGIFAGLHWISVLIYGAGVGLAANGFFDIKFIQSILSLFKLHTKKAV